MIPVTCVTFVRRVRHSTGRVPEYVVRVTYPQWTRNPNTDPAGIRPWTVMPYRFCRAPTYGAHVRHVAAEAGAGSTASGSRAAATATATRRAALLLMCMVEPFG